jgi:hypothetical protein
MRTFDGTTAPAHQLVRIPEDLLGDADPTLHQVAKLIQRRYPPRADNVRRLLQRNYYQIIYSDACYAVSTLKDDLVQGGTGWAVGAFQLLHSGKPLFVYCQNRQRWFVWQDQWVMIEQPPRPTGLWTGIGSRDLQSCGEAAIKQVFA